MKIEDLSNKTYIVIHDFQGGSFGMYRNYTAEEWVEQANEWLWQDDSEDRYNIADFENEQAIIDDIADLWELEIVEVSKNEIVINFLEEIVNDNYCYEDEKEWAEQLLKSINEMGVQNGK